MSLTLAASSPASRSIAPIPPPDFVPATLGSRWKHLPRPPRASPLMLADRLITLAQDADRAGYPNTASNLIELVYALLDNPD